MRDDKNHPRTFLALCLVVKDERRDYLREWIEYHRRLGCEKFYIFDNNSTTPLMLGISDYVTSGVVDYQFLLSPKYPTPQIYAYDRCVKEFGIRHNFIGFIDSDEFIVTSHSSLIPEILQEYSNYGGLALNWKYFGSSGHTSRPKGGGVISHYNNCIPDFHVKTIINSQFTVGASGEPHSFKYMPGYFAVDSNRRRVRGPFNPYRNASPEVVRDQHLFDVIFINHYVIRSLEDFGEKMQRGTVDGGLRNLQYFQRIDRQATDICPILLMPPDVDSKQISLRFPFISRFERPRKRFLLLTQSHPIEMAFKIILILTTILIWLKMMKVRVQRIMEVPCRNQKLEPIESQDVTVTVV